jgi:hypothetical protein
VSLLPENKERERTLNARTRAVHVEGSQHLTSIALTSSAFHIELPKPDDEEQLAEHNLQAPLVDINSRSKILGGLTTYP